MPRARYSISIDGKPVTSNFAPLLQSLTITDSDGGKSDTCDIVLDDSGGQIEFPRSGAEIDVALWWSGRKSAAVTFKGKTDDPVSEGARGSGMTMTISAKSADMQGKGKDQKEKHKDDASFGDVAKEWGKAAGITVKVQGDLAKLRRDYWHMNESFFAWGRRVATEFGAVFKTEGNQAVFVPRNSGQTASGQTLPTLIVRGGDDGNLIKHSMSPTTARTAWKQTAVRYYDPKDAKYKRELVDTKIEGGAGVQTETQRRDGKDSAKDRAKSNAADSKRGKGGGTVTIDGDPAARSQVPVTVEGVRPGIDGSYRATSVTHRLTRDAGWQTDLQLEAPDGDAGKDKRKAKKKAGSGGNTPAPSGGSNSDVPVLS